MQRRSIYFGIVCLLLLVHCKDPYTPPVKDSNLHYLVVDGTINSGAESVTTFRLTHAQNINDTASIPLEENATVYVEAESGTQYQLPYTGNGYYIATGLVLLDGSNYRLHISTQSGKEYVSDYTPLKIAPPIDSVSYGLKNGGMQIWVNAHDPSANTRYYRWSFQETWEYHAEYISYMKYQASDSSLIDRPPAEWTRLFYCWHSYPSTQVLVGTSSKLSADIISQFPINYINQDDERLDILYSIQVTQSALTKEAYNYWLNLKKISEQIGSVFGPLPSEIHGNIHNIADAAEPVIGYVSASAAQQTRIFIKTPITWRHYTSCFADTVELPGLGTAQRPVIIRAEYNNPNRYPLYYLDEKAMKVLTAGPDCVDCLLKGGTPDRPPYWP